MQGTVRDFDTKAPIPGARVEISGVGVGILPTTTTGANGVYRLDLSPRQFSITAFRGEQVPGGRGYVYDYLPELVRDQRIDVGDTLTFDFTLKTRLVSTSWTITGVLVDRFSHPIADGDIYIHDPQEVFYPSNRPNPHLYGGTKTDSAGRFTITSNARVETATVGVTAWAYALSITGPVATKEISCCSGDVLLASPRLPENR